VVSFTPVSPARPYTPPLLTHTRHMPSPSQSSRFIKGHAILKRFVAASHHRSQSFYRSVQEIRGGECGNKAGFSHSTFVLPCQFSLRCCVTFIYHEGRIIGPLHAAVKRQPHPKNRTKCNGNVIESSDTRLVHKTHLTFTADI